MTEPRTAFPAGTILGYPRIGRRRELKRAVEAFWAGTIDAGELEAHGRRPARARPASASPSSASAATDSSIPESFSYYDQVLDAAVDRRRPARALRAARATPTARSTSPRYFTIARGDGRRRARSR